MSGKHGKFIGRNTSLDNNRKLLNLHRYFKYHRDYFSLKKEYYKAAEGTIDLKTASKKDLLKIREKIIKEREKKYILFAFVFLMLLSLGIYSFLRLIHQSDTQLEHQEVTEFKKKESQFLTLIEDGDEWFKNGDWKNSIFFYKKAHSLFPENYEVNYRLVRSYSFNCQYDYENCFAAKELLDKMFIEFPDQHKDLSIIKETLYLEYQETKKPNSE